MADITKESNSAHLNGEQGPDLNKDNHPDIRIVDGEVYVQGRVIWWLITGALSTLVLVVGGLIGLR